MSLTPEQIETVREIILYTSYDATAVLCSRLSSVQETATIADIAEWATVRSKYTKVSRVGSIYLDSDKGDNRLAIINRVRMRLGLPPIEKIEDAANPSQILVSTPQISGGCCE